MSYRDAVLRGGVLLQQANGTGMGGGFWSEDFRTTRPGFSLKNEPDGSQSMLPANGTTAHFWLNQGLADGRYMKAAVVTCDTRLVLANPSGPDDRSSARYLLSVGADWRKSDYGCPFVNGITVCNGIGVGKMVRIDSNWKSVAYSTMSAGELSSFPLPAASLFGASVNQSAPATTTTTKAPSTTTTSTTRAPIATTTTVAPTTTTKAPVTTTQPAPLPTTSSLAFLDKQVPYTAHEGAPHGVPTHWRWATRAMPGSINPPNADSKFMNMWGQVYVDSSNPHPANTRVALKSCRLLILDRSTNTWRVAQDTTSTGGVTGGYWKEDFGAHIGAMATKAESDGSQSLVPPVNANAHFWPKQYLGSASDAKAVIGTCDARLVLNNPAGPDDRANARYMVSLGAHWRTSTYGCPPGGRVSLGSGKLTRVGNDWRTVAFTSMSATDVRSFPLPPATMLRAVG